ncbi:MAG: putative glycosyltransferase [Chloroflexi bacterium OLB15]|nr:MAG: putative glycosyltransferase [Chloroflexi bacterium OLB15]
MVLEALCGLTFLFISLALIAIAMIAILNALTFPRLKRVSSPVHDQLVSILIPARNEEAVIVSTLTSLLAQTGVNFEILVLDDGSTDGTAEQVRQLADPRVRLLAGKPLQEGWFGKNWACHQLAVQAQGDLLLFTDADVIWNQGALAALLQEQQKSLAALVTIWPTQITQTWSERLIIPLMALTIIGYLPSLLVNKTFWPAFAAANGQCLLFTREGYQASGGHEAVRSSIVEDIALAHSVKRAKLRLWMADGSGLITCRMYRSWPEVRSGFAKNIIAGYGGVLPFLLGWLFHWLAFLLPVIYLIVGLLDPQFRFGLPFPTLSILLFAVSIAIRALSAAVTRQRIIDAPFLPFSVILMSIIALQALYWQLRYGGPRWKGRTLAKGAVSLT